MASVNTTLTSSIASIKDASGTNATRSTAGFTIPAGSAIVLPGWNYNSTRTSGDVTYTINGGSEISFGAPLFAYSRTGNSDRIYAFAVRNVSGGTCVINLKNCQYDVATPVILNAKANCLFRGSAKGEGNGTTATSGSLTPYWPVATGSVGYWDTASVAIGCMTHNVDTGTPTLTEGSGWTLLDKQQDYDGANQPGLSHFFHLANSSSIASAPTISQALNWLAAMVFVEDPPIIYLVSGGTTGACWFGSEADGGADSVDVINFPVPVLANQGIIPVLSNFAHDPSTSRISDDGGHTWTLGVQSPHVDGVQGSFTTFHVVTTTPVNTVTFDATALTAGDAGRYGQFGAFVVETPDTVNGFFTATPVHAEQTNVTTVNPGNLTPTTNLYLLIFGGNNRGHTTGVGALKPFTFPAGYELTLTHPGINGDGAYSAVHNSTTQSGWWFGFVETSTSSQNKTFGFDNNTGGARSILAAYNILGGDPAGGTNYDEQISLDTQGGYALTVQRSFDLNVSLGAGASAGPGGGNSISRDLLLNGTADAVSSRLITVAGLMSLAAQASAAYANLHNSVSAIVLSLQGDVTVSKTQTVGGLVTVQAIANVAPNPVQQALNVVALNANVNLTGGLALIRSLQLQLSGVAELSATGTVGSIVHDFLISLAGVSNLQVDKVLVLTAATAMQGQGTLSVNYQLQVAQTIAMSVRADVELTRQSIVGALLQLNISADVAMLAGRSFAALVELAVISTLESLEGGESGPALETLHFTLEMLRTYGFTEERFR